MTTRLHQRRQAVGVLSALCFFGWIVPAQEFRPGVIRADVRLVEIFATVMDPRGRHISGLTKDHFEIADNGTIQQIVAFQNVTSELTCAVLLDTTGSMNDALPLLKNAVMRLIDSFRPEDLFAVYTFNTTLRVIHDFSRDKRAAKKAVLRVQARGATALFDALLQVTQRLEERSGKRAIIVFTDGKDNSSALTIHPAIERVKRLGVPVYTVAQGEALRSNVLLAELKTIAGATGGLSHAVKRSKDVDQVFADISEDLRNTYMLTYEPPAADDRNWRRIAVSVPGLGKAVVRAKEGYYPR